MIKPLLPPTLVIGLLMLATMAHAIDSAPAFEDPVQQARYQRLVQELRCVQCRNQSIADSNVSLAADLRKQVREQMAAGRSDAEIFKFMTDRYGEYILFSPPVNSRTWLLWGAPLLLLAAGAAAVISFIVRKSRMPIDGPDDIDQGAL